MRERAEPVRGNEDVIRTERRAPVEDRRSDTREGEDGDRRRLLPQRPSERMPPVASVREHGQQECGKQVCRK